ncbi:tRNA pseudouridine synthase D, putative [Babesia caballi]|uniref:tRNA pseudouridine synthase D, putative n=1 Tax=Babesia caballi TaxID=5871 RepID=A0AAV4LT49_BABCB|nr:tRNA pseudouridine synthase D, putative [Babesia caballi]
MQDVTHLHPDLLERLDIRTVPVIVSVCRGQKFGEFTRASAPSSAPELCRRLVEAQALPARESPDPDHARFAAQIEAMLADPSTENTSRALSDFESQHMQRLEVDDQLRRLLARARLRMYRPDRVPYPESDSQVSLEVMQRHLETLEGLISAFSRAAAEDLIALYAQQKDIDSPSPLRKPRNPMPPYNSQSTSKGNSTAATHSSMESADEPASTTVAQLLDNFLADCNYLHLGAADHHSAVSRARLLKVRILQHISVALFFDDKVTEALEEAVRGYEELVQLIKDDAISVEAFENHEVGRVLELMLGALPWTHPAVLKARAALETVDGPRLLNRIPERTRPLGGPVSKRRGVGGRYSWHGPDYRPKKYRPRDPEQYLNEWRYQPDSNLPTY